jgi:thiamine pyrophosphokinase
MNAQVDKQNKPPMVAVEQVVKDFGGLRAVNKVSITQMQADLDSVTEEVKTMLAEHEENQAKAKAEQQAKNREKAKAEKK